MSFLVFRIFGARCGIPDSANKGIRSESQSTPVIRLAPCLPLADFPELTIVRILPHADKWCSWLGRRPRSRSCPCCGRETRRVHSHCVRRLADLPSQGRVVEIRLHARRFRCANSQCQRRIFNERLPETVRGRKRDARHGSAKANWRSASRSAGSRVRVCRANWPCRPAATRCCG
ncbi:transposase family protein [Bradyrhizobium yuanmingense]|uniref:transposase family protein n=1 Tax=Bradyrhizobium yuanmingense TaxID=108015 RepID=UPI003515C957